MAETTATLPDFKIALSGGISGACLSRGLDSFHRVADFIHHLPYGRNADKSNLASLFTEGRGTCSTKHAFLSRLAQEQGQEGIQLTVGLYRMHAKNTPAVARRLGQHGLNFIPEAHCYLKFGGRRFDFTKSGPGALDFEPDLIEEISIEPEQINGYKVSYHKTYLKAWLQTNPELNLALEELWQIREQCIGDLSAH